eukprot:1155618-Pelagomonas_calceolata.AAC.3
MSHGAHVRSGDRSLQVKPLGSGAKHKGVSQLNRALDREAYIPTEHAPHFRHQWVFGVCWMPSSTDTCQEVHKLWLVI